MGVTASELRQNIYRVLDEVLDSGVPVEIERRGRKLRIVAAEEPSKLERLTPHPGTVVGAPEDLVHTGWYEEWKGLPE